MNYIVVKGDIINSRKAGNRDDIQQQLARSLSEMNKKYEDAIAAKFMITSGDGFQGLMHTSVHLFDIINCLEDTHTVQFRIGIGIGEVTTKIDPENSAIIDGPCYHYADDMLNKIALEEKQNTAPRTNIKIGSDTTYDGILNGLLSLRYVQKATWTARQKEVIQTYMKHNENQYETAAALGVNQSTVSRALKVTDYYSIKAAEMACIRFLKDSLL